MTQQEYEKTHLNLVPEPANVGECLLIVSRDYRQAKFLANQLSLPHTSWKFIAEVRDLMGWSNARVFYYADWYLRPNSGEIYDAVKILLASGRGKMFTAPKSIAEG